MNLNECFISKDCIYIASCIWDLERKPTLGPREIRGHHFLSSISSPCNMFVNPKGIIKESPNFDIRLEKFEWKLQATYGEFLFVQSKPYHFNFSSYCIESERRYDNNFEGCIVVKFSSVAGYKAQCVHIVKKDLIQDMYFEWFKISSELLEQLGNPDKKYIC